MASGSRGRGRYSPRKTSSHEAKESQASGDRDHAGERRRHPVPAGEAHRVGAPVSTASVAATTRNRGKKSGTVARSATADSNPTTPAPAAAAPAARSAAD